MKAELPSMPRRLGARPSGAGWSVAALAAVASLAGCANVDEFRCATSDVCVLRGQQGTCEPTSYCSFPDSACASGRRYGALSGPRGDRCVGDGAGADAAVPPIDGARRDAAADRGPSDAAALDAGDLEAAPEDAAELDAAEQDAAEQDAAEQDAGPEDAGTPDLDGALYDAAADVGSTDGALFDAAPDLLSTDAGFDGGN
jgi:hypothetical protein